jgi:hypothetical protein
MGREGHDADVELLHPLGGLGRGLALLAAARLDHVERVEAEQDPARDLERPDRDAEQGEDDPACRGEQAERDRHRPGPAAGVGALHLDGVPLGHREEARDHDQIHDEEDRGRRAPVPRGTSIAAVSAR